MVILQDDGHRYLLAASGDTERSGNLRAAGIGCFSGRGRSEEVIATEVRPDQRPPLIGAYLQLGGTRFTVASTFRALPGSADHRTFGIFSDHQPIKGPTS